MLIKINRVSDFNDFTADLLGNITNDENNLKVTLYGNFTNLLIENTVTQNFHVLL